MRVENGMCYFDAGTTGMCVFTDSREHRAWWFTATGRVKKGGFQEVIFTDEFAEDAGYARKRLYLQFPLTAKLHSITFDDGQNSHVHTWVNEIDSNDPVFERDGDATTHLGWFIYKRSTTIEI